MLCTTQTRAYPERLLRVECLTAGSKIISPGSIPLGNDFFFATESKQTSYEWPGRQQTTYGRNVWDIYKDDNRHPTLLLRDIPLSVEHVSHRAMVDCMTSGRLTSVTTAPESKLINVVLVVSMRPRASVCVGRRGRTEACPSILSDM